MKTYKIALLSLIAILAFACSNADTTSTKAESSTILKSNADALSPVSKEVDAAHNNVAKQAEAEIIAKSDVNEDEMQEEVAENLENIENPNPKKKEAKSDVPKAVPTSIKIEKPVSVKEVKENVPTPPIQITDESIAELVESPPSETVAEETKEVLKEEIKETQAPVFNHDAFDALLKKHVSSTGKVNYSGFKSSEAALDDYLDALKNNPPNGDWSQKKTMAYYINAYNAGTIKLILKNYPVKSIMDLHGGKPWDVKSVQLGEKKYTLNNIENDILRPKYKDARIHFAVNCAAKSCPPLLNRAWTESNLNQYFEKQAKAFINNSKYNSISAKEVEISNIFNWYAVDFGNIISYLNKYSDTKINADAKVTYKEYDWGLNN